MTSQIQCDEYGVVRVGRMMRLQTTRFAAALWAVNDPRVVLRGPNGVLSDRHFALSNRCSAPFQIQSERGQQTAGI